MSRPEGLEHARQALDAVHADQAEEESISDLIADLMHLADSVGLDGYDVVNRARFHYEAEAGTEDERNIRKALGLIAEELPTAFKVWVETSDQDYYGFVLQAIEDHQGKHLDVSFYLVDEVNVLLQDIRWNGAVGENRQGLGILYLPHDVRPCDCPEDICPSPGCCKDCGKKILWMGGWSGNEYIHEDEQDVA